jgi:structure-specific recognition protein 1
MPFSEITAVTFSRVTSANASTKTFEIKFSLAGGTDYAFSSIPREEHQSLDSFCRQKKLKIRNEIGDEGAAYIDNDDDSKRPSKRIDYHDDLDVSESDDEDFKSAGSGSDVAEEFNEDYSSSSDEDGEGGDKAAASDAGSDAEEAVKEKNSEKIKVEKPKKKKADPSEREDEPKKKKAKKDPNAPKRGLTSFLYFSQENRAKVNAENPGMAIGDVAKILGAKWKELSDAEKTVF